MDRRQAARTLRDEGYDDLNIAAERRAFALSRSLRVIPAYERGSSRTETASQNAAEGDFVA